VPCAEELSPERSRGTGPRATGVERAAKRSRGTGPRATGVENAERWRGTGPRATDDESVAKRSRGTGPRATRVEVLSVCEGQALARRTTRVIRNYAVFSSSESLCRKSLSQKPPDSV